MNNSINLLQNSKCSVFEQFLNTILKFANMIIPKTIFRASSAKRRLVTSSSEESDQDDRSSRSKTEKQRKIAANEKRLVRYVQIAYFY